MVRKTKNYKKQFVIRVMSQFTPVTEDDWRRLLVAYKVDSHEAELRSKDDVVRYWKNTCCNNFKKTTGKSSKAKSVRHCQEIQARINKNLSFAGYGAESDVDDEDDEEEEDEEEEEE